MLVYGMLLMATCPLHAKTLSRCIKDHALYHFIAFMIYSFLVKTHVLYQSVVLVYVVRLKVEGNTI